MRECILLFGFQKEQQKKLAARLLPARFRVRVVCVEEYTLPIGALAGIENLRLKPGERGQEQIQNQRQDQNQDISQGNHPVKEESIFLDAPMIVMAGVTTARLEQLIQAVKRAGIGPVPYKAVLTETNQYWKAAELLEELKKEHEAMTGERESVHAPSYSGSEK